MLAQLVRIFAPQPDTEPAHRLYIALVEQARNRFFYEKAGVPDTLDGRFELIVLHMFAVLHRLQQEREPRFNLPGRQLMEAMMDDMDRSLREIGVGDLGVGRRVKQMADALHGRIRAYDQTLENTDELREALRRNLYGTVSADEVALGRMEDYLRELVDCLKSQQADAIIDGRITFPILK